jgi:VWFA-related protein
VFLLIGALASPLLGLCAGDEEQAERLGGLSNNDAYDHSPLRVDVFVRDKDGNPVTGLKREQFRLFQDGAEVPITSFTAFAQTGPDSQGAALLPAEPAGSVDAGGQAAATRDEPIYILLFIDNRNLRIADRNRVLRALHTLVRGDLGGPAQIMIVSYLNSLEIVQPFTDDSGLLVDALRQLRRSEAQRDDQDDERERIQREIRRAEKNRNYTSQARNREISDLYTNIREYADEEEMRLNDTLMAIRTAATSLSGVNDRKYLIYVSNGLPMALGAELMHQFAALNAGAGGQFGALSTSSTTSQAGMIYKYNRMSRYDAFVAAINAQEVTIHTIDATGSFSQAAQLGDSDSLRSAATSVVARENLQAPLRLMAEKTGGLTIMNTDDFEAELNRIRESLQTYYSIGYDLDAGSSGSDTVHYIEVRIDSDAEYEALYKRTLVEKSIQSRVQDEVTSGLFFDQSHNPMGLEARAGRQVRATENQWQLPLTISLPVQSVAMIRENDEYVGHAVLFIAMRDLQGGLTDVQRQAHTFRLTADEYEQRKEDRFPIYHRLLIGSADHRIVVGVLDETTRQTSTRILQIEGHEEEPEAGAEGYH